VEQFFFVFVVIVIAALAIWGGIYQSRVRIKFWEDLAKDWGFRYRPDDPYGLLDKHDFSLFQEGHSRKVEHTLEGEEEGRRVVLFDYRYTTGSGKNQTTHYLSALIIETPVFGRGMTVRPENFLDRVAAFFGFDDINFEYEEFNRAFQVRCGDKKFAYDVFHTGMMEMFLQNRWLTLEWHDFHLLLYQSSMRRFDRRDAETMRELARRFVGLLPEYLIAHDRGA
jgi:hypothetical protein